MSPSEILSIPEVAALSSGSAMVRIPAELNVPLTPRVRRLIDTRAFRHLARVGQLGLVSLVYPGATHSRFEHSLGVYRTALRFLRQLATDARFVATVDSAAAELFVVTALLHDVGHWPYCHPIEDLGLDIVPEHEAFVARYLEDPELADLLREDWGIVPDDVVALLAGALDTNAGRVLASMLSGPIDVDKLDYLQRDSLHAGVPYGRHFDEARLISSLCLNEAGDGIAITEKGKTAAELMVFARYVMFSEVYWHHGVRAATAMLQRAFFSLRDEFDLAALLQESDGEFVSELANAAGEGPSSPLVAGLFGDTRRLYKRVAQFGCFEHRELYERIARRPYPWLVDCAERLAELLSLRGLDVGSHEVLIDAPPAEKEVEFRIQVFYPKEGVFRSLEDVSPVVRALAREQFDDYVKRVRVYAHERVAAHLRGRADLAEVLSSAAGELERG